ncbi:MAG TPA: sialidase family protein [Microlunatus sp.]
MIFEDLDGSTGPESTELDPRFDGVLRPGADPLLTEALLPVLHPGDSHAASLTETPDGDLLCAWFNGPQEGDPGTNVVLSRLPAGGTSWQQPILIAADPEHSEQNPVIFTDPDGMIWLLHTSNTPHDRRDAVVYARTSTDGGRSWSEPWVLMAGPGVFLRNPPQFQPDGSWLLPIYRVTDQGEYSVAAISTDHGRSWAEHVVDESLGRVQLSVAERSDGSLLGLLRSRDADRIYATSSDDLGRTWTTPIRTELPNNNSAIQLLRLTDGRLVVIFNDATLERDQFRWVDGPDGPLTRRKAVRTPLTLAISADDGRTWPIRRNLQNADIEYRDRPMGYSYPALLQTSDGRLQAAYSMLRKTIKHVTFEPDWIEADAG